MAYQSDIFFKGPETVLSNFYPSPIEYNGVTFSSVEHAYQFRKSIFHYHFDLADEIYHASDARTAKSLSKAIQCESEWFDLKFELMRQLVKSKYQQVPLFRNYLEQSNRNHLIHNVRDNFWGTSYGVGENKFGQLLMDVRDEMTPRLKICIFGSSYVKHLSKWCAGDFKVPSVVRFYYKSGMKVSAVPSDLLDEMLAFKPDIVYLQVGGNDISKSRDPALIVGDIKHLVEICKARGVRNVYISEIIKRGDFRKSPGLDLNHFGYCRKYVNRRLEKLFGNDVVNFPKLRFPRDYKDDKVHLNESGLRLYQQKMRRFFLSLVK